MAENERRSISFLKFSRRECNRLKEMPNLKLSPWIMIRILDFLLKSTSGKMEKCVRLIHENHSLGIRWLIKYVPIL